MSPHDVIPELKARADTYPAQNEPVEIRAEWQEDNDASRPARGLVNGLLLSLVFWIALLWLFS